MPQPGKKIRHIGVGAPLVANTARMTVVHAPQFNNTNTSLALQQRTDMRQHSKKQGRQESRAPKYNMYIIAYMHYMACPKGFHHRVKYEHVEVGAYLSCTRGIVTKYTDVCARGFKWKKSSKRSNLQMTTPWTTPARPCCPSATSKIAYI